AQIIAMAKQLEKLSTNTVPETCSGMWCKNCNIEGHTKDIGGICTQKVVRVVAINCEIFHGDYDA
ncbi:hypothetical protein KI387_029988, partial [Taxus chinensis]